MREIEVSAVLPVYNDLSALKTAIPQSLEVLETIAPGQFELIVAEDGSTDGSTEFVREYEAKDPRVRLFHSDERLGRGRALNRAFTGAEGSVVCYYDVDLATDMRHLAELIGAIRDGYDIATGSRLLPESIINRSGGREIYTLSLPDALPISTCSSGRSSGVRSTTTSAGSKRSGATTSLTCSRQ